MSRIYVALDLEFTGLDPQRDEITEIGMVKFQGDEVLETFASLVHTSRPIPYKIEQLSGITQADVESAPSLSNLRGQILAFVKSYPLVGHSIEIDLSFLNRRGRLLQNLAIDTFELASILVPEARRYSLADLTTLLGIAPEKAHRALADATATKDLFLALVRRAEQWDTSILAELAELGGDSDWPPLRVFRDILSERRDHDASLLVKHEPRGHLRLRSATADDLPPLEPTETIIPVDPEPLAAMIAPGGLFAQAFAGYEFRPQQAAMLTGIAEAFNTPTHLLVEAGTGTGKSLAYLLPAIDFAVRNGRRVVISSNTINLQDQLYNKDIPDLQRILPTPFSAALLKGRANYLCLRRLAAFRRQRQLNTDEVRVLAKVLAWLPVTASGDRSDLLLINDEDQVWAMMQSSPETCLGDRCPFRQSGQCFFYRARARAERSHLLIVNHALLLSDLAMDSRVLPEYRYLIIDEAHHLEDQATSQFGLAVGRQDVYQWLGSLLHDGGQAESEAPGGILSQVPGLFREGSSDTVRQLVTTTLDKLRAEISNAQRRLYELFNLLDSFLEEQADGASGSQYDARMRLTSGYRVQPGWSAIEIAWESLSMPLCQVIAGLETLVARLDGQKDENEERDDLLQMLKSFLLRGQEMWSGLNRILLEPDEQDVYWVEVARRSREITLNSAPLHVGSTLSERLFMEKDCVVLTSATLRTAGSYAYIEERLGLEEPMELTLDSPFDYQSAVLLYVPKDIPEPNEPFYQKSVEQALIDLCLATEGRALILFTSNSQLHATYRAIAGALDREGIIAYGQGIDGSRRQILENFKTTERSVLLGTRSFWEGVDVVGQALSCLVIVRLPFAVPTDPVFAARAETFDDAFNQFYLPDAILRFRQGFGRLIRSQEDFGVVVVLDKRILTKAYGKTILRSLPGCTARQGPLERLPVLARRWLDPNNRE
jgi:DNA polymerase-3 subunit epsilon/ATP-dependent DNA helicase DinG